VQPDGSVKNRRTFGALNGDTGGDGLAIDADGRLYVTASKGVHVDLIKLYGSMELAPLVGLADVIVDLVSTGKTLKANNLVEVERIMDISSRLVVNQAALKLKREPIRRIIDAFAAAVAASQN
jgi:ATP phosphoribosyltransferase